MVKAPSYDWRCPKCEAVNAAGTGVCTRCQHDVTFQSPGAWRQMADRGVPLWRRIAIFTGIIVGAPLLFLGVIGVRACFPENLSGTAYALVACAVGGAFVWCSLRLDG